MATRVPRSLKHEYEQFVELEIENYKESIPRSALLKIGDEAASVLAAQPQLALTEMLLCEEVDRIIRSRLRLPSYRAWRQRRLKVLEELRRPERWGLRPDDAVVRVISPAGDGQVLVAGASAEGPALYLAAQGCEVTAIDAELEPLQRVVDAAEEAGLSGRVNAWVSGLGDWVPAGALSAVVCAPEAFAGLTPEQVRRAIETLQSATVDGGVHLVRSLAGTPRARLLEELRSRYAGWDVHVETEPSVGDVFYARKGLT